jgi:hypothetical protein
MPYSLVVTTRVAGTVSATTSQAQYFDTSGTAQNTTSIVGANPSINGGNIVVSTSGILSLKQATAGVISGATVSAEL